MTKRKSKIKANPTEKDIRFGYKPALNYLMYELKANIKSVSCINQELIRSEEFVISSLRRGNYEIMKIRMVADLLVTKIDSTVERAILCLHEIVNKVN